MRLRPPTWLGRPLGVALALAIGIAAAPALDRLGVPVQIRWLAFAGLVPWSRRGVVALAATVVAFGLARGARAPVRFAGLDDREVDRVAGVIGVPVVQTQFGYGAPLATEGGGVWLYADRALLPGQHVVATGLLRSPRGARGIGQPDRAAALAARGAEVELVAETLEVVTDEPDLVDRAWRWATDVRVAGGLAIEDAGGDAGGRAAMRGIALGDRADVPPELDANWRTVGIFHVLSVSGLHLAVIAGLAYGVLRRTIAALAARARPARWAAPPAIAIAIAYTMITGAQLATIRALVVVVLVIVAAAIERPLRLEDALGAAAIALLAWRPADLWDPSFQLSFVAALVLVLRGAREGGPRPTTRLARIRHWIASGMATSAWVGLATAPITAYHFQQVQLGGVVGNLVLTPVVELVALPLALGGLALGLATPVRIASDLVALVDRGAGLLAHVTPVGAIAVASPLMMAVLVALAIALAAWPRPRGRLIVAVVLVAAWLGARSPPPVGALRVTFVDVGQGDAALVELPGGEVWLIDAGGEAGARDLAAQSATGRTVERVLRAYGHDRIDLAIISHPHPDHYLGLVALAADRVPIDAVWAVRELDDGRPPRATPRFPSFETVAAALGAPIAHPPLGIVRTGVVSLEVLGPRYGELEAADPVRTVNDNSLVLALRYAGRTIVFAGDAETEGEADAAAHLAGADLVKVAHHGSPTSSTAAFVAATHPRYVVISCGRANRFGFPSPAVVARWTAAGAHVLRTDREGTIAITIDAEGAIAVE